MKLFTDSVKAIRLLNTLVCCLLASATWAQLPQCDRIYMDEYNGLTGISTRKIYNYNPLLPVTATNPVQNTILLPIDAMGLTVSEVLGSGNTTLTFYTIKNDNYWYYNPTTSTWVNTGHYTGNSAAVNIAAGGGAIYNLVGGTGQIYKYDGTGNGYLLTTVPNQVMEGPYDLLADCEGNFYVLNGTGQFSSRSLRKFSTTGVLLQSWTVTAGSNYWPSGGFGIIGTNFYTDHQPNSSTVRMANGTIGATNVNVSTTYSAILPFNANSFWGNGVGDLGSCASAVPVLPAITIATPNTSLCSTQPVTFTSTIVNGGSAPAYQWFVNGVAQAGATAATFTYTPANGDVITAQLSSNASCASVPTATSPGITLTVHTPVTNTATHTMCQGQSYTWGGATRTTAGTYTHTFTNTAGCDSVVTLTLTVNPAYNSSVNASICNGGSYLWGGTPRTAAGTYPHTFTTALGCDSIVTLHLSMTPNLTNTIAASICPGGSYLFGGTPRTAAGTYSHTFASTAGCDSIVTLNLSVHSAYNTSFNASTCQGTTYTWAGQSYTTAGSYPRTFSTLNGCDSIVTLNLTVLPAVSTTLSAGICQGETYSWAGQSYTTAGAHVRTFTAVGGCDSVVTLHLTVHPVTTSSFSAAICQGTAYQWAGQFYTAAGSHPRTFTSSHGCDSTVTLQLSVTPPASSSLSASFCEGSSYAFAGNTYTAAGTYTIPFSTGSGCDSVVTLTLTARPAHSRTDAVQICQGSGYTFNGQTYTTTGSYAHVFSNTHGCDSIVTIQLTVAPPPHTHIYDTICAGQSYEFHGVSYSESGAYTHTFKQGDCDALQTLHLFVRTLEQPLLSLADRGCQQESIPLTLYHTSMERDADYYWDLGAAQILSGSGTGPFRVHWQDTGWHRITFTQQVAGCGAVSATDSIYIHPTPHARILSTQGTVCALDTITLKAAYVPEYSYEWFPAARVVSTSSQATARLRVQYTGWVGVTVTNNANCSSSDSVQVQTENCCTLEVPSAFSPNGDSRNDVFRPVTKGNQEIAAFRVVNRWGQVVYESLNHRQGWDGTFNGVPQPVETYMYYLKYRCADGTTHEKWGDVILVR